jgi:hypothetical protein
MRSQHFRKPEMLSRLQSCLASSLTTSAKHPLWTQPAVALPTCRYQRIWMEGWRKGRGEISDSRNSKWVQVLGEHHQPRPTGVPCVWTDDYSTSITLSTPPWHHTWWFPCIRSSLIYRAEPIRQIRRTCSSDPPNLFGLVLCMCLCCFPALIHNVNTLHVIVDVSRRTCLSNPPNLFGLVSCMCLYCFPALILNVNTLQVVIDILCWTC